MRIVRTNCRWRVLGFGHVVSDSLESLALRLGYRVGAVCEELGLSERYLHNLFLRDVGLTPKEWMQWERMVVARRLLVRGLEAPEVAATLGFAQANSFRREFQAVYGISPWKFLKLRRADDS